MNKKNFDPHASLELVVKFIRGNINLEDAKDKLCDLGFNKENVGKVLKDTPRDNLISFKKNKDKDKDKS